MDWAAAIEGARPGELAYAKALIERRLMTRRGVVCTCCGVKKRRDDFSPNPYKRNGLQSHCKSCRNGARRRRYWDGVRQLRLPFQTEV